MWICLNSFRQIHVTYFRTEVVYVSADVRHRADRACGSANSRVEAMDGIVVCAMSHKCFSRIEFGEGFCDVAGAQFGAVFVMSRCVRTCLIKLPRQ
jgi:hypothetical protein